MQCAGDKGGSGLKIKKPESSKLMADPPLIRGDLTLIPISKVTSTAGVWEDGAIFHCSKTPEIVVIVAPWGKKALRMDGVEVPLEEILKEFPGLEEILAPERSSSYPAAP